MNERMPVPEIDDVSIAFGNIKHLPKIETLPEAFQRERHPACDAVQGWFFSGAKRNGNSIVIDGKTWTARDGIDATKALRAIKAALGSFEPSHEDKIAGCGFLLDQWFEAQP